MNNKKRIATLCTICLTALIFSACGTSTSEDNTTDSSASVETRADGNTRADENTTISVDTDTAENTNEDMNIQTESSKVSLTISGYDIDNPPRLDGSLANQPLLIRLEAELTGTDLETAETFLADSFIDGGTSTSWGNLIYESMDLIISYEPPQEVKDEYVNEFEDLEIDPLGCDGLVFIVNVNNPIESLTIEQIRDIYTGKITDWSEVGGEAGEIRAFQRNSTSGSQTLLNKLVMNGENTMEPETDMLIGTMSELIEQVAAFDGSGSAIGFSVYYYADKMKSDPNLKIIQVEGIEPSNDTIEDHSYPLVNDFYIAIRASESEDSPARLLRNWLLSDEGRALLEEEGYVWARNGMDPVSQGAGNPFH